MNAPRHIRLRPKKSLGQNFLRDDGIAGKIVALIDPGAEDCILEIGPGEGALTRHLAGRCRSLVLVDVDARAAAAMREMFPAARVIHGDILACDLGALAGGARLRIVGNIPYYITSPVLFHVLDHRRHVRDLTIMVQKEVGLRLAARPGTKEYGILSVLCGYAAEVRTLLEVKPGSFYPRPSVTSLLVSLTMRDWPAPAARSEEFFRALVRGTFGKRRKTLRNSLRSVPGLAAAALPDLPALARRPEELTVAELVALANTLLDVAAPQGPGG